jgi:hypothetical protein
MLAVDPHFLNCMVYLYPTEKDAQDGTRVGGSGFIVGVESRHKPKVYHAIVTNRHVVDGGNHFVRFNSKVVGDTVIMRTMSDEWVTSSDDDLAVLPTGLPEPIAWVALGTDIFLDESCTIEGWPVFPGDEVFFYGRFIQHDGCQRNKPVMRFGSISMLADASVPIDMGTHQQVGFLVECRSLSGFSGSPAFVRLASTRAMHPQHDRERFAGKLIPTKSMRLLGVDCGHFPFWSRVRTKPSPQAEVHQEMFVETNSGMAVIVPAWRLLRMFSQEPLASEREAIERRLDEKASISILDGAGT